MADIIVSLGDRSYPLFIDAGILNNTAMFEPYIAASRVLIITNTVVAPLYLDQVSQTLNTYDVHTKILPDGEKHKRMATAESIFDTLIEERCDRKTTIVALGGGVVGDIAGFVAACYQRGVPYIQVPTTLLAQVDSSVGGKTAVNHPGGKNMIGVFYQPRCVIADTNTLETLNDRELKAGLAEVIKYGFIQDVIFLDWVEENIDSLLARDKSALAYAIRRSCEIKADVVAADEKETGLRAILNLGHTFGHAIEAATGYTQWLHGEAVAAGMVMAVDMSYRMGNLNRDDKERVKDLLRRTGLPVSPPDGITRARFMDLMSIDKKVESGNVRLVLLSKLGQAELISDYPPELLNETLSHFTV